MASLLGIRKSATTDAASGLFNMRDVEQNKQAALNNFRPNIYNLEEQRKAAIINQWGDYGLAEPLDWTDGGSQHSQFTRNMQTNPNGIDMDAVGDRLVIPASGWYYQVNSDGTDTSNYANRCGAFYVYKRTGTSWAVEYADSPFGATSDAYASYYGAPISDAGDRIACGGIINGSGVYVYDRTGTSWSKSQLPSSSGQHYVRMSGDGNTIVACPHSTTNTTAKIWTYSGGSWSSPSSITSFQNKKPFGHQGSFAVNYDATKMIFGHPEGDWQWQWWHKVAGTWTLNITMTDTNRLVGINDMMFSRSSETHKIHHAFSLLRTGSSDTNGAVQLGIWMGTYYAHFQVNGSNNEQLRVLDIDDTGTYALLGAPEANGVAESGWSNVGQLRILKKTTSSWNSYTIHNLTEASGLFIGDNIGRHGKFANSGAGFVAVPRDDGVITIWDT